MMISIRQSYDLYNLSLFHVSFDSSVGRAVDCSSNLSGIHRSLVQIRLEGVFCCCFRMKTFYYNGDGNLVRAAILEKAAILFSGLKAAIC